MKKSYFVAGFIAVMAIATLITADSFYRNAEKEVTTDESIELATEIATITDAETTTEELTTTEVVLATTEVKKATTEQITTTEEPVTTSRPTTTTERQTTTEVITTTEEPTTQETVSEEPTTETSEDITEEPTTEQPAYTYVGTFQLTAYCATGNPCADGVYPQVGYTVACNDSRLWHKWIYIEGYGTYYVHDRGGMSSNVIDIFMSDRQTCINFGRQSGEVYIVN